MSNKFINKIIKRDAFGAWRKLKYRKLFTGLAYILSALTLVVAPTTNVFATSTWDSLITTTNQLIIENGTSQNITSNYMSIMEDNCPTQYSSFVNALSDSDGRWAIVQFENSTIQRVHIGWSTDSTDAIKFRGPSTADGGVADIVASVDGEVIIGLNNWGLTYCNDVYFGDPITLGNATFPGRSVFVSTYPVSYPEAPNDYEGEEIPGGASLNYTDTDGDGLSDLVESPYYPFRNEVFCDMTTSTCAYPNPTKKDIFVEIDWMNAGLLDIDKYKPSSTQLAAVVSAFDNKNINLHFDTGQYGGGEMVSYTEDLPPVPHVDLDFYNYKNGGDGITTPKFSPIRQGIWRYMLAVDHFYESETNSNLYSGRAEIGNDDIIIATGRIKELFPGTGQDTAISGTIMHELGHSLCLSTIEAPGYPSDSQDESCIFAGIHSEDNEYPNYESSMSYDHQFDMIDFSDGSNGSGDHDDWSAVMIGMNDFVEFNSTDPTEP